MNGEHASERPSGEQAAIPEASRALPLAKIGRAGDRLTKDEAFDLVQRAIKALGNGQAAISSRDLRRKAFELLGRDSESLSERFFARILKDAQDAELISLKRRGRDYDVESRAGTPTMSDRLNVAAAAHSSAPASASAPAAAPAPAAPAAAPTPVPLRGGFGRRDVRSGRPSQPPPDLLSIGVVEIAPTAAPAPADDTTEEAPAAKRAPRRRGTRGGAGRSRAKAAAQAPNEAGDAADAPAARAKRPRRSRAKGAAPSVTADA